VIAINCIGLGIAQGIWSGLIIVVNFFWGAFVFQEPLKSLGLSILGICLLMIGLVGMAVSRLSFWPRVLSFMASQDERNATDQEKLALFSNDGDPNNTEAATNNDEGDIVRDILPCCGCFGKKTIGYLAAIFNGVWGGSVMVPMKYASKSTPQGIEYVFSFATGALMVNIVLLIMYFIIRKCVLKKPVPSFHFKLMAIPGAISGILWSIGNYMSTYSVLLLGQAIGYPAVQVSLIVSGLWGILYYKELSRTQMVVWFVSAATSLGGIAVLAQMK